MKNKKIRVYLASQIFAEKPDAATKTNLLA